MGDARHAPRRAARRRRAAVDRSEPTRSSRSTPARAARIAASASVTRCVVASGSSASVIVTPVNPSPRRSVRTRGDQAAGPAAVGRVRGVRDHHERSDAGRDRAAIREETRRERARRRRRSRRPRRRSTSSRGRARGSASASARRRRPAARPRRPSRPSRSSSASIEKPRRWAGDERSRDARHVRDGREVDVDAEPLERRRRVVPSRRIAASPRWPSSSAEARRWRPAEAPHRAALLVGHHEERVAAGCVRPRGATPSRARTCGALRTLRAHQDHAADLGPRRIRSSSDGVGRRPVDRRYRIASSSSRRTENGRRQSSSASPSIVSRHS